MNKGDETKHGVFLGEVVVDREKRLTKAEAEALVPADYGGDREQAVNALQDKAVAYLFDKDGKEVTVLADQV